VAGEDLLTYSGQAAIAYQDALNQARNAQNALLRQYGFTAPDASGAYTIEGAQSAFDPNTLFDKATGGIDKTKLENLAKSLQVGGTGRLADISRAGASSEAEAVMEVRQRLGEGIGGGLMAQRRGLAESMTAGQVGQAKSEFLAGISGALAPIGGAWQDIKTAEAMDRAIIEEQDIIRAGLYTPPVETETPADKPTLGAGPDGAFMAELNKALGSNTNKDRKEIRDRLINLNNSYSLTLQQKERINNNLRRFGFKPLGG